MSRLICTKPFSIIERQNQEVTAKPEILILHRVRGRWKPVSVNGMWRDDASLPTIADCRGLGSPAKFDGVYMRFEPAFPGSDMPPRGTTVLYVVHISDLSLALRSVRFGAWPVQKDALRTTSVARF